MNLTRDRLTALLHYDPATGAFTWKVAVNNNRIAAGSVAGWLKSDGYRLIGVCGQIYRAHRLAWLYAHGQWPVLEIDHINGVRDDNRLFNLRQATRSRNLQNLRGAPRSNRSSGLLGASWHSSRRYWQAQIKLNGQQHHLGVFDTPEAAHAAYLAAKRRLHPACTI